MTTINNLSDDELIKRIRSKIVSIAYWTKAGHTKALELHIPKLNAMQEELTRRLKCQTK